MPGKPKTIEEYLKQLPADRQEALAAVRKVILKNLPKGYEEAFNWGMITYQVPLARLPKTYNGQPLCYAALASTKSYMTVHLPTIYGDKATEKWFRAQFKAAAKKLDMGKACVHFRKLEELPLDVIGETIARVPVEKYVQRYEISHKK
jgi:galactose-1-phosphate uridylyltransferase